MNRALLVERVNQRDCNWQAQESNSAENIGSKHHAQQRNERMQPNAVANDLWLHDLANDDDHHVEDSKPDACRQIAGDQRQYRPGQQNKPAANNGENIEYSDRDGDSGGVVDTDDAQPNENLRKRGSPKSWHRNGCSSKAYGPAGRERYAVVLSSGRKTDA